MEEHIALELGNANISSTTKLILMGCITNTLTKCNIPLFGRTITRKKLFFEILKFGNLSKLC